MAFQIPNSNLNNQINSFLKNLLSIEVNLIVTSSITGEGMESPRHGLITIANEYISKLITLGIFEKNVWQEEALSSPGNLKSFEYIRNNLNIEQKQLPEEDLLIVVRIKEMSDQIKGIFYSLKSRGVKNWENNFSRTEPDDLKKLIAEEQKDTFNSEELILIRKIWEIGTENIAMQSVIYLDGNIVTRIQPKYITQDYKELHNIHSLSISNSVNFWKEIIGIAKDFFSSFISYK